MLKFLKILFFIDHRKKFNQIFKDQNILFKNRLNLKKALLIQTIYFSKFF